MLKKSIYSILLILIYRCIFGVTTPIIPASLQDDMSVLVMNDRTGAIIYQHNADTPRLVASNIKLITTAVALNDLHPDFHWHTKLFYTGTIHKGILEGNIYIVGGGDPTFDDRALSEILEQLKKLQVNVIKGNIIVDNTIFNSVPTYSMLKVENYDVDTILPNGFSINGNMSEFIVQVNKKRRVSIMSNLYGYKIINKFKVNNSLHTCPDLSKLVTFKDKTIIFTGNISPKCNNVRLEFNMVPYADYIEMAFSRALHNLTIELNGGIGYAKVPDNAKLVYDYSSQSLEDALIYMNHYSVNLIAEATLLSLGAYNSSNANTYTQAQEAYINYLQKNKLLNSDFKLENGAGLSRREYMSAKNMANLLWLMSHSGESANFENTLPRAGEDGSLKYRFTNFGERVRFKTGTLNDTRAYSGYFYAKNGAKYIVVIVTNNVDTNDNHFNVLLDSWIINLLTYLN
ncbi:MAG: D-alanyl-D-alanine carboxypeptidase/D-alanyl-D-alanine-endopeptidase [Burkholderiales bacterium]|nr:D-alanyl-D-alanine carboxypeptidase/D-alanyl-D-alanine-endopeptidase [Burkholderiales bacterium]